MRVGLGKSDGKPRGKRLISPAGFVLALLCFGLPFVTVSCSDPTGSVSAGYSGFTLAFGGAPKIATSGTGGDTGPPPQFPMAGLQPMALLTLVAVVVGVVALFIAQPRLRALTSVIAGGAGILLLIADQVMVSMSALHSLEQRGIPANVAGGMVATGQGFWVTLVILLGVTAYSTFDLDHARRTTPPRYIAHAEPPFLAGPPKPP